VSSLSSVEPACERLDPATAEDDLYAEHIARYQFALGYAKGKRVLDCASGVGYGAALLATVADLVIGVDNDFVTTLEASQRYSRPNTRFLQADGRSLPLKNGSLDLVISLETIEHAPHPERFVSEFRRVLAPSGILVLSTPNTDVYRHEDGVENPFHAHEFTIKELTRLLRSYFPWVRLLAERHQTSVVIGPANETPMMTWFGDDSAPHDDVLERSPYVIAVCGRKPMRTTGLIRLASGGSRMQELVGWARSADDELERARELVHGLQKEVQERTAWAKDLECELDHARRVVSDLQVQVAERTTWASDLETELTRVRQIVVLLQEELSVRTSADRVPNSDELAFTEVDADNSENRPPQSNGR
jgi:SAM-dependent methyltransferase